MRHLRIKLLLLCTAIVVAASAATLFFMTDRIPPAILCSITIPAFAIGIIHIVHVPVRVMKSFVSALEMNDSTTRYDFTDTDRELRDLANSMNRLTHIYRVNSMELETRKIYYDRILKIMNHEMRNAITPIVSLTSDMMRNPDKYDGETLHETVALINSQSIDIKRFLDSYHRLTHVPAPEKRPTDACAFFEELKTTVMQMSDAGQISPDSINFIVAPGFSLLIDKGEMMLVMRNFIKNSIEALNGNDNPQITVSCTKSAGNALITIEDNGGGLPESVAANPFLPFHTTKKEGSGIGMFVSRQIVRLHGGDIHLANHPGKGVSIRITLPFD